MSGRRLIDVARIFGAARTVAAHHVQLRRQQLAVLNQTSSLRKLVQGQRFSQSQRSPARSSDSPKVATPIPSNDAVGKTVGPQSASSPDKDVFHERSQQNTADDAVPQHSIHVKQAEANQKPLPDGTIPPRDSPVARETRQAERSSPTAQELSDANHARKVQRQSEAAIPEVEAESSEVHVQQDSDVHYSSAAKSTPVESSLPRVKVPKNAATTQGSDEHVPDKDLNQDVYYSSKAATDKQKSSAEAKEEDLPEEAYAEIFQSRKVASNISGKPSPYSFRGQKPTEPSKSSDNRHPLDTRPQQDDSETAQLAKDLAADVAKSSPVEEQVTKVPHKPYKMRESHVPSSRLGRLWQYGGLATSMAFGAVGESLRRATGSSSETGGSSMLSGANIERLVAKLSRMRGAALKLGQMVSFQDAKMLPKEIQEVLQRVQDSADYMPASQRNKVLTSNLGENWRDLFSSFDEVPMAAASIGQVHGAVLKETGMRVAVKVQYPGVAGSIDSDLNNLSLLLTASKLLPKGLYLNKTIDNARTELAWECDYVREAEAAKHFRTLLADDQDTFVVPEIIDAASGPSVLTMERMDGIGVTKVENLTQKQRDWIGKQILRLCLREITEFRYMQTDPNWTNFLYNAKTNKLELLDFGASREYPAKFIEPYIKVLQAASRNDRIACRDLSIELGYLTGHESKAMLDAHVDSMLTLAEPFRDSSPDVYDFQDQTITERVRALIPVMLRERLAPPPEETYSLHRKLSGAFLLCAKLGSRIECKQLFANAMEKTSVS